MAKLQWWEKQRRTGRTTRLLQHAEELNRLGKTVYVLLGTRAEVSRWSRGKAHTGIRFVIPGDLPEFDWNTMQRRGAGPDEVLLVDHHVIERKFMPLLDALHAFDVEDTK